MEEVAIVRITFYISDVTRKCKVCGDVSKQEEVSDNPPKEETATNIHIEKLNIENVDKINVEKMNVAIKTQPPLPFIYCVYCGGKNKGEALKCEHCGSALLKLSDKEEMESNVSLNGIEKLKGKSNLKNCWEMFAELLSKDLEDGESIEDFEVFDFLMESSTEFSVKAAKSIFSVATGECDLTCDELFEIGLDDAEFINRDEDDETESKRLLMMAKAVKSGVDLKIFKNRNGTFKSTNEMFRLANEHNIEVPLVGYGQQKNFNIELEEERQKKLEEEKKKKEEFENLDERGKKLRIAAEKHRAFLRELNK
ncbi:MAG: hypothetical protein FWE22_08195 [Firmicutes bacterium]|nr:hypothetical protein [Bacillota bacterium]